MSDARAPHDASRFRTKLLASMMVVIVTITGVTLYLAQRSAEADVQRNLHDQFQGEIGYLLGVHEGRRAAITERCRLLATSVRIRAALEENSIDDVYANAEIELRGILQENGEPDDESDARALRARFFRFVDPSGEVLLPVRKNLEPWKARLAPPEGVSDEQQSGYVAATGADGVETVHELIATPVWATDDSEVIGGLVLAFKPVALGSRHGDTELTSGLLLDGKLHLPAMRGAALERLESEVTRAVTRPRDSHEHTVVDVNGTPHLLFTQLLDGGSKFPPTYHVCLYSLAESLARQRELRWRILGAGGVLLLGGLLASHLVSGRFSAPVEQLAVTSAEHQSQRQRAEAELVLSEQRFRSIFENAVEGIFVLTPEGHFTSVNPALARIYGYASPAEFSARVADPAVQLYADPRRFHELLRRATTEGTVSDFETEALRADGRKIWISQNVRAVRNPANGAIRLEGTVEDVTERKHASDALVIVNGELEKALESLKATQQQIIQQERLRALGQMASGVAHDFNNALVPILGFAELLQLNPAILADGATAAKYLGIIQTAAKDASSVVARLREFYRSKDHRESFRAIDLARLVEQAVTLTQPKWKDQALANGATIHVKTHLVPMPPIAGEESALREVLTNLIFNAVDAMPKGGTITIRAERLGEAAVIEVADTGTGMSEEVRARCLEPFFSTKGDRGTGLGLSMVFGIIQRHSGTIDIRSEHGKGTAFVITLPLDHSAVVEGDAQPAAVARPLRVLVVEDEPQVQELLAATLRADGHTVQLASHGVEGLKSFLEGEFDLVLTDKAMPGMSGDQLAKAIKQVAPKMPIILLTGFGQFLKPEDYPEVDVLAPKPIGVTGLREAIANAVSRA